MQALTARSVLQQLKQHANAEKASYYPRFFKSSPGEYGAGDRFIGVVVPEQRKIARKYEDLPFPELARLLDNKLHECRLTALLILVRQYETAESAKDRKSVYEFYLKKIDRVNNWDLVDASCYKIIGAHMYDNKLSRRPLIKLASSNQLWENRIAIISTLYFIKRGDTGTTIEIATLLIDHQHDLIHKAVGWMLREVGKQDQDEMLSFIRQHYSEMPRTMLRYAIEKLPRPRQKRILAGDI